MRRLVAAVSVALLAFVLVGCGGGGEETATEAPAETAAPAPAPAPTDGESTQVMADRSDASAEVYEPMPSGEGVPASVIERLDNGQAMVLFFYNSAQDVTDDVRKQVDIVADDNTGLVDLISYDLGKYTKVDSSGAVKVNEEALANDPKGQEAVQFARQLGVDHVPYLVVVDEAGYEIFWSRGFIDSELLDRQVQRVSE